MRDIPRAALNMLALALLFIGIALAATRNLFLAQGFIGLRHDWPIPPYPEQMLMAIREHFFIWSSRSLGTPYNLYGLPLTSLIIDSVAFLGMDGGALARLLLVVVLAAAGCSMWFLTRTFGLSRTLAVASSIFYMLTPVLFEKIVSGYIHYLVSYALQPVALALFIRATRPGSSRVRELALAGLATALTWYQPQFILILTLELVLWCAARYRTPAFRGALKALGLVLLLAVAINSTLVVSTLALAGLSFNTNATPVGQTLGYWSVYASRSTTLASSFVLVDMTFSYFFGGVASNPFFPLWVGATIVLFGVIYGGTALRLWRGPGRRITLYLLLLSLISAWLGKGLGDPLGDTTLFLFVYIPPLRVFREFGHILAVGALANAGLLGLGLESLHRAWARWSPRLASLLPRITGQLRKVPRPVAGAVPVALVLVLVGTYSWPMLTGDFAGNVQTYNMPPEMRGLYDRLAADPGDYSVLWIPVVQPITYPGTRYAGIDPILLWSPKPTFHYGFPVNGALGPFTQFIHDTLHEARTQYLGDLLSLTSTRYLLLREGPRTAYQNFSAMGVTDRAAYDRYANESTIIPPLLAAQKDLVQDPTFNFSTVTAWSNPRWLPHAYVADRVFLVAGDLSTLASLSYLKELGQAREYLGNSPAFLFLSQLPPGWDVRQLLGRVDGVIVDGNYLEDLALALVPPGDKAVFDHLESYADLSLPALQRWASVQQNWFWRDWHSTASLDDPVLAMSDVSLEIPLGADRAGTWQVLIKGFEGPRSSPLDLYWGSRQITTLYLTSPGVGPNWFPAGDVIADSENHSLRLARGASGREDMVKNPSFEAGWDASAGAPVSWHPGQGSATLDTGVAVDGDFSVRLTTPPVAGSSSSLVGDPIPTLGGSRYHFRVWMKTVNGVGTGMTVEGFDPALGSWAPVAKLEPDPAKGTKGHFQELFVTLPQGITQVRPILLAGLPGNVSRGDAQAWFDAVDIRPDSTDTTLSRVALVRPGALETARLHLLDLLGGMPFLYLSDLGGEKVGLGASGGEVLSLGAGSHATVANGGLPAGSLNVLVRTTGGSPNLRMAVGLNQTNLGNVVGGSGWYNASIANPTQGASLSLVNAGNSTAMVDLFAFYLQNRLPAGSGASITGLRAVDPTRYELEVHGNRAKFIVFSEAYNPGWRAQVQGQAIEPIMVNSGMNGFWLNASAEGPVVLEQVQQRAYWAGIGVTIVALAIVAILAVPGSPRIYRRWLRGLRTAGLRVVRSMRHGGATHGDK